MIHRRAEPVVLAVLDFLDAVLADDAVVKTTFAETEWSGGVSTRRSTYIHGSDTMVGLKSYARKSLHLVIRGPRRELTMDWVEESGRGLIGGFTLVTSFRAAGEVQAWHKFHLAPSDQDPEHFRLHFSGRVGAKDYPREENPEWQPLAFDDPACRVPRSAIDRSFRDRDLLRRLATLPAARHGRPPSRPR
ncbi:MAG: hypothetical protein H6807_11520 [Planctomycetes bacterium]|nr:hypothetical protein [Planctomycetota bacterium]